MSMLKYFRIPFATAGDKVAVPDASQPSGSVSYTDGFGPDYELDPATDPAAKDVPRDESNQLYFDVTNAIKEYQEFGVPDFITAALNGGVAFSYAKYARVLYSDGFVYESKIAANTDLPTVAASWRKLTDNADYLTIATTAFQASVTDGEAVYWTGTEFDEAVADGTDKQNVVGFADVTNGRVFAAGLYAGQLSGLTANVEYFLSTTTPGALASARPAANAVSMGLARTTTSLYVMPKLSTPLATETLAGFVELSTNAEAQAFTANKIIDGAKLAAAFQGANQSLGANGYQKLPGGLIIQWGLSAALGAETGTNITLPVTFPNNTLWAAATIKSNVGVAGGSNVAYADFVSNSQISVFNESQSGTTRAIFWFAIGY